MKNLSANALEVGHSLLTKEVTGCAALNKTGSMSPIGTAGHRKGATEVGEARQSGPGLKRRRRL
jgi:hypothetical protein